MAHFLKVVVFGVLVVAFFAAYSNYGIPQIKPAPPPTAEKVELSGMTMTGFIELGGRIFKGKGTCTLCHNAVGGRAPLLDKAAARARRRLSDPRYHGGAKTPEQYLYESMVKPSAFVVAGFGKAGTNDTESPMPNISAGGVGLTEVEIEAVVAYLQDLAGQDVTVQIPATSETEASGGKAGDAAAAPATAARAPIDSVDGLIAQFTCGACHKVAGQVGAVGPDLTHIGAKRNADYIRRAILAPNADIAEGFPPNVMPGGYGGQLYAKELELLVNYLAGLE